MNDQNPAACDTQGCPNDANPFDEEKGLCDDCRADEDQADEDHGQKVSEYNAKAATNHDIAKAYIKEHTKMGIVTDLIEADLLYQAALAGADAARAYFQATVVRARDDYKMTNKAIGQLFPSPKHEDGITEQSVSKHYSVGKSNERQLLDHRGNSHTTKTRVVKKRKPKDEAETTQVEAVTAEPEALPAAAQLPGQAELDLQLDLELWGIEAKL